MNRFYPLTLALLLAAFFCLIRTSAGAQEIHKWTDANGKVHYGDRVAAPDSSKKIKVSITASSQPPAVPASATSAPRPSLSPPRLNSQKKPVPVDPALVGPECRGLIEKIAAVPAGKNWELLYRQFDRACPGIAYECVEYQSSPQNNQCIWVKRSGSRVLNRNRYP
ncbi:DUF4124 domain-containing protein [Massilia scottii]|uniref:DUF4124 domain-containing protein n=1 Tax=Massilia scottii TaxID=3057166 RepID=UPI0035B5526D